MDIYTVWEVISSTNTPTHSLIKTCSLQISFTLWNCTGIIPGRSNDSLKRFSWNQPVNYVHRTDSCAHWLMLYLSVILCEHSEQWMSLTWPQRSLVCQRTRPLQWRIVWLENKTKPGAFWLNVGAGEFPSVSVCLYISTFTHPSYNQHFLSPLHVC